MRNQTGAFAAKILVVDDEAGFRDLMTYELGSRGHQVITAANGDEALQKAKGNDFDIVVSDLTMPKRGGWISLATSKPLTRILKSSW